MDIFISYSSKTRDVVDTLAEDLGAMGHSVWFDRELTGGRKWWTDILEQIRSCELFVFALTPQSVDSYPCRLEYTYAKDLNKRIMPVMLADITIRILPSALQELQIVDYRQRNKQQLLVLSRALGNLPSSRPLPVSLPPEPETPLSPLARLRDQINATFLSEDDQRLLVSRLKDFLEDIDAAEEASNLLEQLRKRDDLLAKIEKEIATLLGQEKKTQSKIVPRQIEREVRAFLGHENGVLSVAFSLDGKFVLTGSSDSTLRLWDAITGQQRRLYAGHTGAVLCATFSPDGSYILSGSQDTTCRLWDTTTGQQSRKFIGHTDAVFSIASSPDSKYLLTGSRDATARLWDTTTGKQVRQLVNYSDPVLSVAFSPDGQNALTAGYEGVALLWNLATGASIRRFTGHIGRIYCATYSPDGKHILTGSLDGTTRFWNVETGQQIFMFTEHGDAVFSVAFSPDGKYALTGSNRTARLWELQKGQQVVAFAGHADTIRSVSFSPDEKFILTGSTDKTARLWESHVGAAR